MSKAGVPDYANSAGENRFQISAGGFDVEVDMAPFHSKMHAPFNVYRSPAFSVLLTVIRLPPHARTAGRIFVTGGEAPDR